MRVLVTGAAGFIGFHVARRLLDAGHTVAGFDGMTHYYDPALKDARLALLLARPGFSFHRAMLEDMPALEAVFAEVRPEIVVHLAAQAGVRYSLTNPRAYMTSNVDGTFNLLEACRMHPVRHLLSASTSSVYGANTAMPFRETDTIAHPLTLYAASKAAGESMAHAYSHLWNIPTTVFRFFTVYGPWGRPDMAPFKFTRAIERGEPIDVHNMGEMARDFTYVDDLVESILRLIDCVPAPTAGRGQVDPVDSLSPAAPYRIVNIGLGQPVRLMDFIAALEAALGRKAVCHMLPMQAGEVVSTFASADLLETLTGYRPATPVSEGIGRFVAWYRQFQAG